MFLRCMIDGLLLPAELRPEVLPLVVFDGDESFNMQWLEAAYYELVAASDAERHKVCAVIDCCIWPPISERSRP